MNDDFRERLATVPEHLKLGFGPRLKQQFDIYTALSADVEVHPAGDTDPDLLERRDSFLKGMDDLYKDFEAAGGTEREWNILAPGIHYGHFRP